MVSKRAEADILEMWERGLKPTVADIIRLNALALRVESVRAGFALNVLPRVAFLGKVSFREPTIGSEIWLDESLRLFSGDTETFLILRAFSLSRPQGELPDPADEKAVVAALDAFRLSLDFATTGQLVAAVGYAVHGFDPAEGESPASQREGGRPQPPQVGKASYEIGLLRRGMLYRLGSAADLKELPPIALEEMLRQAIARDHSSDVRKGDVSLAEDDYLRTLDEITDRLSSKAEPPGEGACR